MSAALAVVALSGCGGGQTHAVPTTVRVDAAASLCGVLPNVCIQEIDIDDVPWKDDLVTRKPDIRTGRLKIPAGPGWGTELNEDVARAHPWAS